MKVGDLIAEWQTGATQVQDGLSHEVHLPVYDAAKIAALADMFPGVDTERILTDLVAAALNDLTSSFSYEPGDEIAGYDERGEPMYTDAGLRPRFQQLARNHAEKMASNQ